jgi:hypothetical protein
LPDLPEAIKAGIMAMEKLESGWLFSEAFVQVNTSRFSLVVLPEHVQFAPLWTTRDWISLQDAG